MNLTANWIQPKKESVNLKTGKQQLFKTDAQKETRIKKEIEKGRKKQRTDI